jgi:hypothetical protein
MPDNAISFPSGFAVLKYNTVPQNYEPLYHIRELSRSILLLTPKVAENNMLTFLRASEVKKSK